MYVFYFITIFFIYSYIRKTFLFVINFPINHVNNRVFTLSVRIKRSTHQSGIIFLLYLRIVLIVECLINIIFSINNNCIKFLLEGKMI